MTAACRTVDDIPYRTDAELQYRAEKFLARFYPAGTIPIPIERIVECRLKREIVPLPQLRSKLGIEGFISMDLKTITVDEDIMVHYPNRYRFTLAHEVGHGALHHDFIRARRSDSIEDWRRTMQDISPALYGRIEAQAYLFAGFLLVPSSHLLQAVTHLKVQALSNGIDTNSMGDTAVDYMANNLTEKFHVSDQVIARRLLQDGLVP